MPRVAIALLLTLVVSFSAGAAGHDVSAVRYAPANLFIGPTRIATNGSRFLTVWSMYDEYPRPSLAYGGTTSVVANDAGEVAIGIAEKALPSNLSRARIYFGSELAPVPNLSAPTNLVSHFNEFYAVLRWDGDAPGYVVDYFSNNQWYEVQQLPGDVHQATVFALPGKMFRIRAYGPDGSSPDGPIVTVREEPRTRAVRR
jgi:hypothetical protein